MYATLGRLTRDGKATPGPVEQGAGPERRRYVITDVRFPNELLAVQRHKGLTAWVRRPGSAPVNTHSSDNLLGPDDFDIVIENDGDLVHLRNAVAVVATALDLI